MAKTLLCSVLPVHKPSVIGSFDVIREIKKILPDDLKSGKIGHGGTLDNFAEGVLLILMGEATKAFDFLLHSDKIYRAVARFGSFTDTDDRDGKVIQSFEKKTTLDEVNAILPDFTGKIEQVPPRYSALKVNGVRSHKLARNNIEVEMKPRPVTIFSLTADHFNPDTRELAFTVNCSSGTYIRAIARDMGAKLRCGAHLTGLTRLKSAGLTLEQCVPLEQITAGNIREHFLDLNSVLTFPALEWTLDNAHIRNGVTLNGSHFARPGTENGIYKIVKDGRLLSIVEKNGPNYKYLRVFNMD